MATPNSYDERITTGATGTFPVPFSYLSKAHVKVALDGVEVTPVWLSEGLIQISPTPVAGKYLKIWRETSPTVRLVDYATPGTLTEEDLDTDSKQAFFLCQEAVDKSNSALSPGIDGTVDATNHRIKNVTDPVADQDAVTKRYVDQTIPANVSAAQSAAASAGVSATQAATSASNANTSAGQAATSATNAASSASAAAASAAQAAANSNSGAKGGGTDKVFFENDTVVTTSYTLTAGKNAVTAGPVSINNGVTVTVPDGSTWTIV